jgi:hypothetical protein
MTVIYRPGASLEALQPGECTVRPCTLEGKRWWNLWLCVYRDDRPGAELLFAVPIDPRGRYAEDGPGGKTWGLNDLGGGRWQVAPSINVLARRNGDFDRVHPGAHEQSSIWHHTPTIVGVPLLGEPWQGAGRG